MAWVAIILCGPLVAVWAIALLVIKPLAAWMLTKSLNKTHCKGKAS